jgi:hypothetical protein
MSDVHLPTVPAGIPLSANICSSLALTSGPAAIQLSTAALFM